MNKFLVIFVSILVISVIVIVAVYYQYEKPAQQNILPELHNVSVRIMDFDSQKEIKSNFAVLINNQKEIDSYYFGEGYLQNLVRVNESFIIYSYNSSDCYYPGYFNYAADPAAKPIRADIYSKKCGNLSISHIGELLAYDNIVLNITSNGYSNNVGVCLHWSNNILTVSMQNLTKVQVPKRLQNFAVKCYSLNTNMTNNSTLYSIDYKNNRDLYISDSITVYLIDGDKEHFDSTSAYENIQGHDIFIKDVKYIIR